MRSIPFLFTLSLAIAASIPGHVRAQTLICALGEGGGGYGPQFNRPPGPQGRAAFARVENALCGGAFRCGPVTLVENDQAGIAVTMSDPRYPGALIAYSPAAFHQIQATYGREAILGILAHELGHHIDIHSRPAWMDHSWGRELQADAWAGCALARLGLGTTALQNALRAIAAYPSPSHPGWDLRAPAVQRGYASCGGSNFPGPNRDRSGQGDSARDAGACRDRCAARREACLDRCTTMSCEDRCDDRRDDCEDRCERRGGAYGDDERDEPPRRDRDRAAHWCCTPRGRFGPYLGNDVPVGAPCHWNTPYGPVYGQACN